MKAWGKPVLPAGMALVVCGLAASCGGGGGGGSNSPPPDTTAPETTISASPSALSNTRTPAFTFTASETGATFESRVDNAAFAAATSPQTLASLADGSHTFEVRARDAAGNVDATPATLTWTVDGTPPDTEFTTTPAAVATVEPFTFGANAPGEASPTFEMSLNGSVYQPALFPLQISGLVNGTHTVSVRSRDAAGNVDPTPATYTWTVNLPALDTTITAQPPAVTNSPLATFGFTSNYSGATFEYNVDGLGWLTATSPLNLASFAVGEHTLQVRARLAAQIDASPATVTWRVEVTPPTGALLFPPPVSYTDASTLTVRGTAADAYGIGSVSVNGVAAQSATGFSTWTAVVPIAAGDNTLSFRVTDAAGNFTDYASAATVTNRGPPLLWTGGIDFDANGGRLVVSDVEAHAVFGYRVSDGIGELVSSQLQATDPNDTALGDIVVDAPNNRALLLDWGSDTLVGVDLTSGVRTTLSSGAGSGPTSLVLGFGLAHDAAGNRVFVTVRGTNSVIAVNLASGARSVVSSPTVGTGTAFGNPLGIIYDTSGAQPRLLVADAPFNGPGIWQVDIATGNRVLLSQSPAVGTGAAMPGPTSLRLDAARNRLFVLDTSANAVLSIDLANGNRTLIAGTGAGSGPALNTHPGLAFDVANLRLYTTQRDGDILQIDPATQVRTRLVDARVGEGARVSGVTGLRIEQTAGAPASLLFAESQSQRLTRLTIASSARTTVSDATHGSGIALSAVADLVLDTRAGGGGAALALLGSPNNSLVSIDLASGNRTQLAVLQPNTQLRNLRLDAGGNRVLYTNNDFSGTTHGVYAIDLATLALSTISSATRGSGANFTGPSRLILEPAANPSRALVVNLNPSSFVQVDLATGDRSAFIPISGTPSLTLLGPVELYGSQLYGLNIYPPHLFTTTLSGSGAVSRMLVSGVMPGTNTVRGNGPLVDFASGLAVDEARSVAFVGESTMNAIMAIDLQSGDRVIIAR